MLAGGGGRVDNGHWIAWPPALAWMGVLFFLSFQTGLRPPASFGISDKVAHALAYGVLGFLFSIARLPSSVGSLWRVFLVTFLVATFGMGTEILQSLVPERHGSVGDVVADAFGGFLAATLILLWHRHSNH